MASVTERPERSSRAAATDGTGGLTSTVVRNAFPIALVSILALTLSALGPVLFVPDSWMTLVAGREVWESGLPDTETLTVFGAGERWIDQQWLAQLAFYAADGLAGLSGVAALGTLAGVAALGLAVTTSRSIGASARSSFLVGGLCLFVAPWSWQVRAQGLALPLFAGTLFLTATHVRQPSPRIYLTLPLLLAWANVHGSVILGAMIVSIAAAGTAIAARAASHPRWRDLALVPAAWLCAFATPYGPDIADYYRRMLIDPPFAGLVVEWQRTRPTVITAAFFAVAALSLFVAVRYRKRLSWFELVVLAITLAGALQALRGVVWFGLAAVAFVPAALDGLFRRLDVIAPRRANLTLVTLLAGTATVAFVANLARSDASFERTWPTGALETLRTTGRAETVFPSDRHADWLLWRLPELRGRVAFDIRYELLTRREVVSLARYTSEAGTAWDSIIDPYDVVVLDPRDEPSHADDLLARDGARLTYSDERIEIVRLSPAP